MKEINPPQPDGDAPGDSLPDSYLRAILDSTADGLLVVDGKGNVVLANKKFAEMWNIRDDVMATRDDQQLIESVLEQLTDPQQFLTQIEALYDSTAESLDVLYFKDDRVFHRFSAPMANHGSQAGRVWSFRDITGRVSAEAALRDSEQRFRLLYNRTPVLLHSLNAEGQLIEVSDYWLKRMGYTRQDVLGKTMEPFVTKDAWLEFSSSFLPALRGAGELRDLSCEYLSRRGQKIDVVLSAIPLKDDMQSGAFELLAVAVDVGERRRMEEQLRHTQKLESLGLLAGGVAHDFNNLLVGIMGNADLAQAQVDANSPLGGYLNTIVLAAERAAGLSQQMLAYAGKGRFVVDSVDLSAVTKDMAALVATSISKRIRVAYTLQSTDCWVRADLNQLRQIVMNLMSNAADALYDEGGEIHVSTGVRYQDRNSLAHTWLDDDLPPGDYAYLSVQDNGSGIDPEIRDQIFDPFFTSKGLGRGLGLAAVLGIIRGHNGAIDVATVLGEGTCFTILIPVAQATSFAASHAVSSGAPNQTRHAETVLVVDDEDGVREFASHALRAAGFVVMTAKNGREALQCHAEHGDAIGAVLLDLTMPEMDGEETLRHLRARAPNLPVLLSSGYSGDDVLQRLAQHRPDDFLPKPYRVAQLISTLRDVMHGPADG